MCTCVPRYYSVYARMNSGWRLNQFSLIEPSLALCFLLIRSSFRFRHRCIVIVKHPVFDKIVLLFIALNCITLAMERPSIPPDSIERQILSISNDLFTVLFLAEMSLKVIACGGFQQYFKSGWNVMDGVLVSVSVVDQVMSLFMSR